MTKFLLKTLILLALPALAFSQNKSGFTDNLMRKPVYFDFTAFRDTSAENTVIEVYYKIYSTALTYEKRGEKFMASYEVNIVINKKGKQITGGSKSGELFAETYEATRREDDFIIDIIKFSLPPDDYGLEGNFIDLFSGDQEKQKLNMKLKEFKKKPPSLSGIEFVRETLSYDVDSPFGKDGLVLIPSVSRVYGYSEPELKVFYQIYNQPGFKGDYLVFYEISKSGKIVNTDTAMFVSDGPVTDRLEKLNVEEFMPGEYKLSARVTSPGHKLNISTLDDFIIEWSALSIVKNDFKTAVEQLKYIASRDEMKILLDTPVNQRLIKWNEFWDSQDYPKETPENEPQKEYYRRLRYADLNFGHFGRDGWNTDMGMVYVTYGPPDEIERHPFDLETKPYQVWYYYERELRFLFIDRNGYGDFELQYPYDGDIRRAR